MNLALSRWHSDLSPRHRGEVRVGSWVEDGNARQRSGIARGGLQDEAEHPPVRGDGEARQIADGLQVADVDRPGAVVGRRGPLRRCLDAPPATDGLANPFHDPLDVDFLRIGEHTMLTVAIPVRFDNEEASPGLKRGGVLNVVQHELQLVCDAGSIPNEIHIPLDGLEIGDSIHISAVKLPEGVTPANTDEDFTVATIVAPSAMKAEEEEEAAAAEGEVPTVGDEDAEGEGEAKAEGGSEE